uniref:G-protein coupled receptors family 3 profile domain-containing protein n=1 Tax=Denticeps clupeoides TaxID=299321 RepID=A0AAY4BBP8_9TELE
MKRSVGLFYIISMSCRNHLNNISAKCSAMNPTGNPPNGCSSAVDPLYFNLCDLGSAWGIVVEAFAGAGVVTSFLLMIIQVASLPFVSNTMRKSMVPLQAIFQVFTTGLFGLAFAFIVGKSATTCVARRFLFGVLFAGCFSCLLVHGLWLAILERKEWKTRGWLLSLGVLALWLVEVIINTEWLTITKSDVGNTTANLACGITHVDFVMALIYVIVLLVAVLLVALFLLTHKHKPFRRDALYILLTSTVSASIWTTWIIMYVSGNARLGKNSWDDPTLAIGLVSNGWVFLLLYTVPGLCIMTRVVNGSEEDDNDSCQANSLVYENITKDQMHNNTYVENRGFVMDEHKPGTLSPYHGYNGQGRSGVYQPTELALISKGLPHVSMPRSCKTRAQGRDSPFPVLSGVSMKEKKITIHIITL